ncbi:hypothetical protein N0V90_002627 [Kalmusia sp. IMI 367209]|nr:hypothetical protein N0V90_002627 [Kalmusia sp. IMI 367209]
MATEYFSDNDAYISNHPLPSPADTPYHSLSRRNSRYGTPVSEAPGSPAPFPPEPFDASQKATSNGENVSILDPRRFTPTLHASLVSEILSLRRDLDSKNNFIEDLETSLHTVRNENEALTNQLSTSTREGRAVKGQLQQLENATLSALEEIAGERDKLKEANGDLKDKLESAQKKLRSQEDDSTRVHDMWAHEKEVWTGEKRSLERRVHISESRLKLLLEEIAMHEDTQENDVDSEGEGLPRDSGVGPESDAGSVRSSPARRPSTRIARHSRNLSNSSFRSFGRGYRMSLMSGTGSEGHGRGNGMSLADELVFDEEEEDLDELELDSDDFPEHEMRALRALESRQSMRQDDKAKRVLGLSLDSELPNRDSLPATLDIEPAKSMFGLARSSAAITPQEITLVFPPPRPLSIETPDVEPEQEPEPEPEPEPKPRYVDTGVQPSPPPSPVRPETSESSLTFKLFDATSSGAEIEANQRKKRVSAASGSPAVPSQVPSVPRLMTSASSQTSDQPLSPPATPKVESAFDDAPLTSSYRPEVASIATQTEPVEASEQKPQIPAAPTRAPPPVPITIPSIAIHAPSSTPSSPKEPILPPGTKSAATQTTIDMRSNMRTIGMQTEPIMIDRRFNKLPPHLLPSAITSKPGTPEPGQERSNPKDAHKNDVKRTAPIEKSTAVPSARQDLKALLERVTDKIEDRYPGNNDNGPLARNKDSSISRPFRTSSLFAGFDGPSSDEEDLDAKQSDEEQHHPQFSTPMLSSRNAKNGRVFNNPPTPVPEEKEPSPSPARPSEDSVNARVSARNSIERPAKVGKPPLSRQPSIRRSAMIQSGTTAHMRSRSPSIGSIDTNGLTKPPFPVPTRSSSRRLPLSKSEGSQSPTPRNSGAFAGRRPYGTRQHQRKDSLRKVRSAAVMPRSGRPRSKSPPLPATPTIPPSPSLPPIPSDTSAGYRYGHRHQLSTTTTQTAQTGSASVGSSVGYQASVVDAIAATMVGEWMWKYVRKRKAFGGQESPAEIARAGEEAVTTINGVRHKRWVWISPYERSVLWSNKQPTTGPALLGKSGRKLTIQSVLDVVDNTPIPRNAGTQALFNRSILILTPARALKFTTSSRERHYLWLTALSFLAHSSSPIPDLGPAPLAPPPEEEPEYRSTGATLRRSHVRDSVRLAKGKANPVVQRYQSSMEPMPELNTFRPEQPLADSADPPTIPRGPVHSRKRSSTGPLAPRPTQPYRTFSHQHVPSSYSSGSSDMYSSRQPPSVPSSVYNPHSVVASTRTSEASNSTRQHFFDTMGTVRMEAFIDDSLGKDHSHRAAPAPGIGRRRGSQWSSTNESNRAGGLYEDFMAESNDPFRGF